MKVSIVELADPLNCANTSDRLATRWGMTRELTTMTGYSITRAWAEAFSLAGFDGIHYASRYTTAAEPNAWALFGDAGADTARRFFPAEEIDGVHACREAGLTVASVPSTSAGLRRIRPGRP